MWRHVAVVRTDVSKKGIDSIFRGAISELETRRVRTYGMSHLVALVRTDVSEEHLAFFIRLARIRELGTTLAVTSNRRALGRNTLKIKALRSSETSVLTSVTRRKVTEDGILHFHRRGKAQILHLGTVACNVFLLNVCPHKWHIAYYPRRRHSSCYNVKYRITKLFVECWRYCGWIPLLQTILWPRSEPKTSCARSRSATHSTVTLCHDDMYGVWRRQVWMQPTTFLWISYSLSCCVMQCSVFNLPFLRGWEWKDELEEEGTPARGRFHCRFTWSM
jgi:hypothetical protein